jgi:hypothetical protein
MSISVMNSTRSNTMASIMQPRDTTEEEDPFADLVPVSAPPLVSPLEYGSGIAGCGGGVLSKEEDTTDRTQEDTASEEAEEEIEEAAVEKSAEQSGDE